MHIPRIYYPGDLNPKTTIILDKVASHHLLRVLRLKPGDNLVLFNGEKSGQFSATFVELQRSQAVVQVGEFHSVAMDPTLKIHLGQGLSRSERMDYCIQKSVELGVSEITPLCTARCVVKLNTERLRKRLMHWQRIIISACEQSGRTMIPKINPPISLEIWLQQIQGVGLVCDLNCRTEKLPKINILKPMNLLIGPESGLTAAEVQAAKQAGFYSMSLGPRILRTETAAVVAITLLQSRWGDLAPILMG